MRNMSSTDGEECPFVLNLDPDTFKAGDLVSYRVPNAFGDTAFVGEIVKVETDRVIIRHYGEESDDSLMRATRESRPAVTDKEAQL